jgi:ZIP family zinc transporter
VLEALFWGAVAAASLVAGALIAFATKVPERVLGLVLAFGAGVLVSSVAYELVADALSPAPGAIVAVGFAAGALTFYLGSVALGRMEGGEASGGPGSTARSALAARGSRGARSEGLAIVLGAVLDGIPESVVLGVSLVEGEGVAVAFLTAVVISNVPEGLGATADLLRGGFDRARVLALWATVVVVSGLAAALGFAVLQGASTDIVATVQSFAAGALIAMLAESMIPEAYEKGGRAVGLATAFGFAVATLLSYLT